MASNLEKDLEAMVRDGVLTGELAGSIRNWYAQKASANPNRLILVFGVLGVLLVGTGIILLVAHNWDNLGMGLKTFFAFLPMVLGQAWAGYTLLRKSENEMHREMSAAWLAISIGVCIALVSQIYHLPGNVPSFLLTWLLLGIPIVYLLRSSVASLLYIAGATWYGVEAGYGYGIDKNLWMYWLLIALVLPHYFLLFKQRPGRWLTLLHHYALPISLLVCLATIATGKDERWMLVAYMSLLGLFYIAGYILAEKGVTGIANGYRVIGWTGTLILLFMGSFRDFWSTFAYDRYKGIEETGVGAPLIAAAVLTISALAMLVVFREMLFRRFFDPILVAFLVYGLCFLFAPTSPAFGGIIMNLFLLLTGVLLLLRGQQQEKLAQLNLGLGIIAILAICRFFDTDLNFIIRGLIFIAVGAGFVYFNMQLIRKKNKVQI